MQASHITNSHSLSWAVNKHTQLHARMEKSMDSQAEDHFVTGGRWVQTHLCMHVIARICMYSEQRREVDYNMSQAAWWKNHNICTHMKP